MICLVLSVSGHNNVDAVVCMVLWCVFDLAAAIMWFWVYGVGSVSRLLRAHEKYLAAKKAAEDDAETVAVAPTTAAQGVVDSF